jgi:SAM-dependent methyltransferase
MTMTDETPTPQCSDTTVAPPSAWRDAARRARRAAARAEDVLQRSLASLGVRHSETRLAADSQQFWREVDGSKWRNYSHWRDADVLDDGRLWDEIGAEHLALFEAGARMSGFDRPWRRVLEWGCGGGANAVAFAPRATELIGVDVSIESLEECARQVRRECDTPFVPIAIDVDDPEAAVTRVGDPCDVFLCCYVFELLPSPEYGERLLRIAHELLAPGGLAMIQIKYDGGRWRDRPRRRGYQRGLAEMTTYPIDGFWQLAERSGLTPRGVHLVPQNELDHRYAYFFLSKEAA